MHLEVYRRLRQHYHRHPMGFPETHSGVELDILERLFSAPEADVALHMTPKFETLEDLSKRLGMDPEGLVAILEGMRDKGLVMRQERKGEALYGMIPFLPGIYEFQVKAIDKEMAEDLERFYPDLARELFSSNTPMARVVAVERKIPVGIEVFPFEKASELVRQADKIALADCICRKEKKLLGQGCDRPRDDVCIILPPLAEHYIEKDLGREATKEEALKAIKRGEAAGLVRTALNVREKSTFICQCCSCCCPMIGAISRLEIPTAIAKSNFAPVIDIESCTGCAACMDICPTKALSMQDEKATLDSNRCIGCGLCSLECPAGSIVLHRKEEVAIPPQRFSDLMTALAREKGRTYFYK